MSNKLDAKWKDEQVKFLEKQQQRQAAAGGGPSQAKPSMTARRPATQCKHPGPFSRDPALLFKNRDPTIVVDFPRPMNSDGHTHTGVQPTKFSKVMLMRDIGSFKTSQSFDSAQVNFFTGLTKLYHTENDALMGSAAFDDVVFCKPAHQYANMFYIREILDFLQRGHSLLEPSCRCIHKSGTERAKELGITESKVRGQTVDKYSLRDGECSLPKARSARTAVEIAHEIAVGDLYSIVDTKGRRLIDDMAANPKILITEQEGGVQLFAFKATFDAVSSKQELLQLVNISPLGLKEPAEKDTYNGVRADIDALADEGEIFKITNTDQAKTVVLFPRFKNHEVSVDDDIKKLWADNGIKGRLDMDDVEKQLVKAGLQPSRQAKPEKRVLGKRKGDGKMRRRTKKRQNNLAHLVLPSARLT